MKGNLSGRIVSETIMKRILVMMAALFAVSCGGGGVCSEEQLREARSASGKYVAAVFRGGCGAMGGTVYHVNIRRSQESFSSDFRGMTEDSQVFLTKEGLISVSWKGDETLVVDCEGCSTKIHPDNKLDRWQDVSIEYHFRERDTSADNHY